MIPPDCPKAVGNRVLIHVLMYPTQMGRYKKLVVSYDAKCEFDVIVEYTQVDAAVWVDHDLIVLLVYVLGTAKYC